MNELATRLAVLETRLALACARAKRPRESVKLVAVTLATGVAPPLRNMRYPATPVPTSVDAVQVRRICVGDVASVSPYIG